MEYVFYIMKKILTATMYPIGATSIFLIAGIVLLSKGWKKVGLSFVSVACIILLVFSLGWTGLVLLKPLEDEAGFYGDPVKLRSEGVKCIVVLAGACVNEGLSPSDRWNGSVLRLLEGVRLWRAMPETKLALSGGAPSSADAMAILPLELGVPREAMILETRALDTADEVRLFKPIVGNQPFALVTSASHLPRAIQQFRAKGTKPIPCPCDFRTKQQPSLLFQLIPGAGMENSKIALHEYYGRFFYWLKSRVAPASDQGIIFETGN